MAFNSNSFTLSGSASAQTLNLPSRTSSVLLRSPTGNASNVTVRLGGGSPITIRPGENLGISIETILQTLELANLLGQPVTISPSLFMSNATITVAVGDSFSIDVQEWRTG